MIEPPSPTPEESHILLHQLELMMVTHEEWLGTLHKGLICGDALNDQFVHPESFHNCRFGRWLYGLPEENTSQFVLFQDIEFIHRRMHQAAFDLIQTHDATPRDMQAIARCYDEIQVKRKAFRWTIDALRNTICHTILLTDPLTGTLTRGKLEQTINREIETIRETGRASLIVMLDLDHFKKVNDCYGHLAGDMVLTATTKLLKSRLRPTDLIFRYGGEEFLLFLPCLKPEPAESILNRLRESLANHPITIEPGVSIRVTASFGAALINPDHSADENIDRADQALYEAKNAGRNCVVIA